MFSTWYFAIKTCLQAVRLQSYLERNCYEAWCSLDVLSASQNMGHSSPSSSGTTPTTPLAVPMFSSQESQGPLEMCFNPPRPPSLVRIPSFQFSCSMDTVGKFPWRTDLGSFASVAWGALYISLSLLVSQALVCPGRWVSLRQQLERLVMFRTEAARNGWAEVRRQMHPPIQSTLPEIDLRTNDLQLPFH